MARDVVGSLSIRDKIFLFMHKNKHQRLRSTAIGIIWNRCVRELAKIILLESVERTSDKAYEWETIMSHTFQFLSAENIDTVEMMLHHLSIEQLLELEMPSDSPKDCSSCPNRITREELAEICAGRKCWDGWLLSVTVPVGRANSQGDLRKFSKRQKRKHRSKHESMENTPKTKSKRGSRISSLSRKHKNHSDHEGDEPSTKTHKRRHSHNANILHQHQVIVPSDS